MKRLVLLVLVPAVSGLLLVLSAAGAEGPGRYIVTVRGPAADDVGAVGGVVLHEFKLIKAVAVEMPPGAVRALARRPNVVKVEVDAIVTAAVRGGKKPPAPPTPTPPPQSTPWGVGRIDAPLAWGKSTGAGVKVAVIDTGIDKTHPDLAANVKGGVNFVPTGRKVDPTKWADDDGHGTHVAGTIGALNNNTGVVGVAPGVSLYAVKVLDKNGNGYVSDVIRGIEWAVANNMKVANMSLSTSSDVAALKSACDAASASVMLVAAAGNSGGDVEYPAKYDSVVAVGATDISDKVPTWSSRGAAMELAAPGVDIRSTWPGGGYQTLSGTSMATPHVTGTCALVLGLASPPNLATLRATLRNKADDIAAYGLGWDEETGDGLVDAEESVTGEQTDP